MDKPEQFFSSFYLEPRYDSRRSFYHKAVVERDFDRAVLYSYGTKVAEYINVEEGLNKLIIYGLWSATTVRHIKEFATQCDCGYLNIDDMRDIIEERGVYL